MSVNASNPFTLFVSFGGIAVNTPRHYAKAFPNVNEVLGANTRTPSAPQLSVRRSANLKSAVSQDCILLGLGVAGCVEKTRHAADLESAIRQSATLRYGRGNH
jgi:hypothetical protein